MGEYKLRVLKNRALRKKSGPKRKEVPGDWGRLHNECLLTKRYLVDKIKKTEMDESCGTYGGEESCV